MGFCGRTESKGAGEAYGIFLPCRPPVTGPASQGASGGGFCAAADQLCGLGKSVSGGKGEL